jgi:hypothetical protein
MRSIFGCSISVLDYTGDILTMQFGLSRGDYRLSTTTFPLRSTTLVFSIG